MNIVVTKPRRVALWRDYQSLTDKLSREYCVRVSHHDRSQASKTGRFCFLSVQVFLLSILQLLKLVNPSYAAYHKTASPSSPI